jgi:uncharacterized protein YciI
MEMWIRNIDNSVSEEGNPAQARPLSSGILFRNWRLAMHHILFYDVVDDYVEKRAQFREAHLAYARQAHERGELVLGGALTDPADAAVLVFRGDSPAIAEAFAGKDPYVLNGLVKAWRVRKWMTVVGDDSNV